MFVGWGEYLYSYPGYETRVRIHRIGADGAPVAGWPAGGHLVPGAYDVGLLGGADHVFVSTGELNRDTYESFVRVQRLDRAAAPDPGWPQAGALLTKARFATQLRLFPDGQGGVFADWFVPLVCVELCPPLRLAARVRGDGARDEGWDPPRDATSIAVDGTGGMLLGRREATGRPSVLRVDAVGAPMPGWAPDGNPAMTEAVEPWGLQVTGDGEGGAFVAWRDGRSGELRLYASRLDAAGRLADGWPATASFVGTRREESLVGLVSLQGGVALALWTEWTFPAYTGYLTALRPGEPGPIADLRPVPDPVGFGVVAARPNPANGPIVAIVELKAEGPARVDLVDAAGRVRESQDFSFPWQARGAVRFNQSRTLPAGVYWLNVTQGARRASRKLVVLE